jgi:hypothetical protein
MPSPTTSPDSCHAPGCGERVSCYIPFGEVRETLRQALFDLDTPASYAEWQAHPFTIRMCARHYRMTRSRDGRTLAFQYRNGKIRAYVKEEHY